MTDQQEIDLLTRRSAELAKARSDLRDAQANYERTLRANGELCRETLDLRDANAQLRAEAAELSASVGRLTAENAQLRIDSISTIGEVQRAVHQLAVEKGWWEGAETLTPEMIGAKLALVHSEVSEALEEVRASSGNPFRGIAFYGGKPEGFGIELADAVIRIMDLCERMNVDLGHMIAVKTEFNRSRPQRHGGKAL